MKILSVNGFKWTLLHYLNIYFDFVKKLILQWLSASAFSWFIETSSGSAGKLTSRTGRYLSGIVGSHEGGLSYEAVQPAGAIRRLTTRVADDRAAAQVVLVLCAGAVGSLQGAPNNKHHHLPFRRCSSTGWKDQRASSEIFSLYQCLYFPILNYCSLVIR